MVINEKYLLDYILREGIIQPMDLIASNVVITQRSQRNICYSLSVNNRHYFFKQPKPDKDKANKYFLNEINIYKEVKGHIPTFHFFDPELGLLATEFLHNYQDMVSIIKTRPALCSSVFPNVFAQLNIFHNNDMIGYHQGIKQKHWIFFLFNHFENHFKTTDLPKLNVIAKIRAHKEIRANVNKLSSHYTFNGVIHGDIKLRNILINHDDFLDIKFIDFEFSGKGDTLFDIASVIASSLFYKLLSNSAKSSYIDINKLINDAFTFYFNSAFNPITNLAGKTEKLKGYTALKLLQFCIESAGNNSAENIDRVLAYVYAILTKSSFDSL